MRGDAGKKLAEFADGKENAGGVISGICKGERKI